MMMMSIIFRIFLLRGSRGKRFLGSFGWKFTSSLQMWFCAGILGAFLTTPSAHLTFTTPSNHFPGSTPPPPRRIPSSPTSRSTLYFSPPTALFLRSLSPAHTFFLLASIPSGVWLSFFCGFLSAPAVLSHNGLFAAVGYGYPGVRCRHCYRQVQGIMRIFYLFQLLYS